MDIDLTISPEIIMEIRAKRLVPRIGIINTNSSEYLNDEICHSIDPEWEALSESEREEQEDCHEPNELLIGDWRKYKGLYHPNRSGKNGYSGVMSVGQYGTGNTQIVWSRWVKKCAHTSLCYVQDDGYACGDLDTPGIVVTYSLPPDMFGENDDYDVENIIEWKRPHK